MASGIVTAENTVLTNMHWLEYTSSPPICMVSGVATMAAGAGRQHHADAQQQLVVDEQGGARPRRPEA